MSNALRLSQADYEALLSRRARQLCDATKVARRESAASPTTSSAPTRKPVPAKSPGAGADLSSPRPSKFRSVKVDGYASKRERDRAFQLRLMQEAGQIRNLREQVEYELIPKQDGERACKYRADFVYEEFGADAWREVVEDCKGFRTPIFRIKRKLLLYVHGIRVRET